MKRKLVLGYCPIGNGDAINPFDDVFDKAVNIEKEGLRDVDAVVFWGGADMHPSYYKQDRHLRSQAGHVPSKRDEFEWKAMLYCKQHNIPMIGVCLGAQRMCAFAGGSIIQDATGHGTPHNIITKDGEVIYSTSCHHQMMYPYDIEHELLAWSQTRLSKWYQQEDSFGSIKEMDDKREPEVVWFPTIKGLAIQGHPEWERNNQTPFARYVNKLVLEYVLEVVDV